MSNRFCYALSFQQSRKPAKSSGFTLVELLVSVAIIALLMALILPAVQAARESARTVDCKNRLRQIALALHGYHTARNTFPAGIEIKPPGDCLKFESREGANWLISILPYIEEQAVFGQYRGNYFNEAPENEAVRTASVSLYSCPGDELAGQKIVPSLGPIAPSIYVNLPYMTGSYRGVSGASAGMLFYDSVTSGDNSKVTKIRGVLHAARTGRESSDCEKITTIADGTSNTLMVGESVTSSNPGMHTLWAYSFSFYTLSAITPQDRTLLGDYEKCQSTWGLGGNLPCQRGWGSSHPRLLNFAYADGSVRSLTDLTDLQALVQMATIQGGETQASPE